MNEIGQLFQSLKTREARTVSGAFEEFLDNEINIGKGTRTLASTSQNHLRDFLTSECGRDPGFPRVLSIADSDFLGGSFARHTKIWPLDDIDVYLPLDGHNLMFVQNGMRLPYTVRTDGVLTSNPLLDGRWMKGLYISSGQLINEFSSVLRRHYPKETDVRPNGEAVSVRMSQGGSQSSEGLGYDVVPCFSLSPDDADELDFYLIPNGNDGWIRTNPRLDTLVSSKLQVDNNKTYRKAVKLIKYWNAETLGGVLSSYYIELAIARTFLAKNSSGEQVLSVSLAVALAFGAVSQAFQQGNQQSWINAAPPVEPGDVSIFNGLVLRQAALEAGWAWQLELSGQETEALQTWTKVFGESFPTS